MDMLLKQPNLSAYNCTKDLKVFRIPQLVQEGCDVMDTVMVEIFSDLAYVLSTAAIAANIFKIICTSRATRSWTTTHIYLMNLAVAHIIFLITGFPWGVYLSQRYDWNLGATACSTMNFTSALGHCGSILFICVMSVDRMVAIYYPVASIQYKTIKFGKIVVTSSWGLSFAVATLSYVYTSFTIYRNDKHFCGTMHVMNLSEFKSIRSLILFVSPNILVPTLFLVPCYVRILIYLFHKQARLPCDMGRAVKLDIVYISSFLVLGLSTSYVLMVTCFVYLMSPACLDECKWSKFINLVNETGRLLNICIAVFSPIIYMSRLRMGYFNICDYTKCKLCLCDCCHHVPDEGISTVQDVYIACVRDDNDNLKNKETDKC